MQIRSTRLPFLPTFKFPPFGFFLFVLYPDLFLFVSVLKTNANHTTNTTTNWSVRSSCSLYVPSVVFVFFLCKSVFPFCPKCSLFAIAGRPPSCRDSTSLQMRLPPSRADRPSSLLLPGATPVIDSVYPSREVATLTQSFWNCAPSPQGFTLP